MSGKNLVQFITKAEENSEQIPVTILLPNSHCRDHVSQVEESKRLQHKKTDYLERRLYNVVLLFKTKLWETGKSGFQLGPIIAQKEACTDLYSSLCP